MRFGVVGVALASATGAWLNVSILYTVLVIRGHYRIPLGLLGRLARQLLAALAMGVALYFLRDMLSAYYGAGVVERIGALLALVIVGAGIYFAVAFLVGAIDRSKIRKLMSKKAAK